MILVHPNIIDFGARSHSLTGSDEADHMTIITTHDR